jgi:hypothetical protein
LGGTLAENQSEIKKANKYTLSEEDAFALLYPNKPFDKTTLQRLNSRLTKLLEEYIVVVQRTNDNWKQSFALLQFYNERNLNNLFENQLKTVQKEHHAQPYR